MKCRLLPFPPVYCSEDFIIGFPGGGPSKVSISDVSPGRCLLSSASQPISTRPVLVPYLPRAVLVFLVYAVVL